MRGLFLLAVILLLLLWGFKSPLIFVLGYVWANIFTPQQVAYSLVSSIPVSLIFGALSFGAFVFLKKPAHVKWRAQSIITGVLAVWMTLTLLWAVAPESAFVKWDWAIKSIVFTIIIPHFLQSRRDFEAFIWTIVAAGMAHCIPFGVKVMLSGGGYGYNLGLVGGNSGYAESSTLSMFSVSIISMCVYLYFHQILIPHQRLTKLMLASFIVFLALTAVGTYARTALVCLAVLGISFALFSKRKIWAMAFLMLIAFIVLSFTGDSWIDRMSSINDGSESSAMGRIAVWKWVVEYIAQHPLGGSFVMYVINSYSLPLSDGTILNIQGKAFHSVYFEMLGEGGVPGFFLYMTLIGLVLRSFLKYRTVVRSDSNAWLSDAGRYLLVSSLIFLAGGAFIGVAFQSYFYYLIALSAAYLNLIEQNQRAG